MKNFLQIIIIIFFFNSYSLSEENKIVYIDMDLLISKSLAGKSINNQIKSKNKNNLEKFKKIESDIKKEDEDISNKKNILSEDEYKKMVTQLNKKIKNYRVMVSENVWNKS